MKIYSLKKISFLALGFLILCAPSSYSEAPSANKVDAQFQQSKVFSQNTLTGPLLIGGSALAAPLPAMSLMSDDATLGYKGDVEYQRIDDLGIRVQFSNLNDPGAFFWSFGDGLDFRDRWVKIRYSGALTPSMVKLVFDQGDKLNDSEFMLPLNPSNTEQESYFKLPGRLPYAQLETIRFVFDPKLMERNDGDFVILGVEVLEAGQEPFAGNSSDMQRFDWYNQSFQPDNQLPASHS